MKKSEVIDLVAALRDRFPRQKEKFGVENAKAYCEDLVDLEFSTAFAAVRKLAATVDWFPSIAEIRKAYAEIASPIPDADKAWATALKYGNKIGWGRLEKFNDTKIHPAIEDAVEGLGGWKELGRSTDQTIDRAHFLKLYKVSQERHFQKIVSAPLLEDRKPKMLGGNSVKKEKVSSDEESKNARRLGRR